MGQDDFLFQATPSYSQDIYFNNELNAGEQAKCLAASQEVEMMLQYLHLSTY
jgi:hypothetical protein